MDFTLVSIVVGLGLTELLSSFYRLIRERRQIAWDPLPLAWALIIAVALINFWWGYRAALLVTDPHWTVAEFLVSMIAPVFLFLACSAALPRFEAGEVRDMVAAYGNERSVFLAFFLAYQGGNWLSTLQGVSKLTTILAIHRTGICIALVFALVLRSRRWDWFAVATIATLYALRISEQLAR